uniref:DedA family protein n=1 Tax=Thermorudis peleae TaxID=1382356 RepID=A0A831TGM8_9BACT
MSDWVLEILVALGYLGLAILLVVENVFPPIPSEAVLPLAGFLASRGHMSLWGAIIAATIGSCAGAWILYSLGRWGGRALVLRYGHILRIDAASLARAEGWFARWGDWVVLGARVVPIARSVVSVPAGTMRMSPLRFTVLTAAGSSVWNTMLIGAGWLLGENWERVSHWFETYSDLAALLLLAALGFGLYLLARRRRERQCEL